MQSLITVVRTHDDAAAFLAWPGDFDLDRGDHGEDVHLASGASLEGFAGHGAGGAYFFCGEGGEERPILFADSEGRAAVVAVGLPELLRLLLVAPWWQDCQTFTAEESRKLAAEYLEDMPDLWARRDRAAAALGLSLSFWSSHRRTNRTTHCSRTWHDREAVGSGSGGQRGGRSARRCRRLGRTRSCGTARPHGRTARRHFPGDRDRAAFSAVQHRRLGRRSGTRCPARRGAGIALAGTSGVHTVGNPCLGGVTCGRWPTTIPSYAGQQSWASTAAARTRCP